MFGSGKRGSYFLQSCHDQLACASVSSSSARPNVGRYLPKFNSKSARNAVTDVADLGAARLLPKSFHHQSPGSKALYPNCRSTSRAFFAMRKDIHERGERREES